MQQQDTTNKVNPVEEMISLGSLWIKFLVSGAESNGSVAVFEMGVEAGVTLPAPPHSHDGYEETIYGIEGALTWTVDGTPIDVGPGQTLCIRRGQVHGFANNGDVDARAVAVVTPALLGADYFRGVSEILHAGLDPASMRAKIGELMRRHGLTPAVPPVTA